MHLELWDAIQGGRTLADWRAHPSYAERVAGAVAELRVGRLQTASGATFPVTCRSIASVWLSGGDGRAADVARRLDVPAQIDPDGLFAAVRAGRRLLAEDGVVIDLGQTSAKTWSARGGYRRVERDGRDFAAVLAAALVGECPRSLVLAVPCEVLADGLGACSYFPTLSFSTLSTLLPCPTVLVNDAELAAAWTLHATARSTRPRLVLTLGFGVGAALVLP